MRNQMFEVLTKCNTTLAVIATSLERCDELVVKGGYKVDMIRRVGNAARGQAEGICE